MRTHFDRCLGCMACVTACPSGVQYDKLIVETRPQIERARRGRSASGCRRAIFALFTHPGRLRAMAPVLALQQRRASTTLSPRLAACPSCAAAPARPRVSARAAIRACPR